MFLGANMQKDLCTLDHWHHLATALFFPGFPTTIALTKESCEAVFSGIADPPGKYLTGKKHRVLILQELTTLRDTVIYVRKKGDFVKKYFFEFRSRIGLRRLAPALQAALPRSVGSGFKR